jgi:hypothetical protein
MTDQPDTDRWVDGLLRNEYLADIMRRILTACDGDYVEAYVDDMSPTGYRITVDGRWRITAAEFEAVRTAIETARAAGVTTLAGWTER